MQFDRMGRRVQCLEACGSSTNANNTFTYNNYLLVARHRDNLNGAFSNDQFMWDPTEPIATRPLVFYFSNAPPQYYTNDGNKNVSDLTDPTQSLSAHYAYAPFGSLLSSSDISAITNPFRFSSEYADDTLRLVYYNYRHYNYLDGRWIYRDKVKGQPNDLSFDYIFLGNNHMFSTIDLLGLRTFRPHNAINHHFSFPARHYKKNPGNRKFRHTGNHSRLEPVLITPSNKEDAIKSLGKAINKIVNKLFGPEHYSSPYQFIYDQYSDAYNEGLENCKTIERSLGNNSCRTSCEFSTPSKGPYISKSKCKCCEIAIIEKDWWRGDSGGRVYALGWAVYYENKSCDVVRKIPMIYPKSDRESVYITYISNF
jgi:RHS repeat-associated protein